jgi:hypothetical protein
MTDAANGVDTVLCLELRPRLTARVSAGGTKLSYMAAITQCLVKNNFYMHKNTIIARGTCQLQAHQVQDALGLTNQTAAMQRPFG